MANMSYCRFRNTEIDLEDCLDALNMQEELSREEFEACKGMFNRFINFCYDEGIIEDDGELTARLEEYLSKIKVE